MNIPLETTEKLSVFAKFCKGVDSQALVMVTISCVSALMVHFATGGLSLSLVGGAEVVNRILLCLVFLMVPHAIMDANSPQLAVVAAGSATFIWAFLVGLVVMGNLSWPFFLVGFVGFLLLSVFNLIGVFLKW